MSQIDGATSSFTFGDSATGRLFNRVTVRCLKAFKWRAMFDLQALDAKAVQKRPGGKELPALSCQELTKRTMTSKRFRLGAHNGVFAMPLQC